MKRKSFPPVAFAQVAAPPSGPRAIASVRAWRLREPESGRRYTVVRVTSQNGTNGYGEGGEIKSVDFAAARSLITSQRATAFELVRNRLAGTPPLEAAVNNAMMDLTARTMSVPLYQFLGGPVRFKVRLLARLSSPESVVDAQRNGFRAFTLVVPPRQAMTRLQAYVDSVRQSMVNLNKLAGGSAEMVLDGAGALLPGDGAVIARAVEHEHPIWFDEPANVTSQDALSRIADETTVPIGLGRHIVDIADFQTLLRLGIGDILRPSLALNSLHKIRRIAAIAESHYIAVAPYHDGGPLGTLLGIHLGAAVSNFYTQQVPIPASPRDRAMRAELMGGWIERADNGFAALINQPGLGARLDEQALNKYAEEAL